MKCFRLTLPAIAGLVFIASAFAQNVSIVSGNGQVLGGTNFILQPLVVQVTDANGNSVGSGTTVNWQGSGFNGYFLETGTTQLSNVTDANGVATAHFSLPATGFANSVISPLIQSSVTASAGGTAASFSLTQLVSAVQVSIQPFVEVIPCDPSDSVNCVPGTLPLGSTFSGAIGSTSSTPFRIRVGATNGSSTVILPNAAVELLNFQDPASGPAVTCANTLSAGAGLNTVLTDANGMATCTLLFGGQPGDGQFALTVGGVQTATVAPAGFWEALLDPTDPLSYPPVQTAWINFTPMFKVHATPGAPGSIKIVTPAGGTQTIVSGNNLSLTVETDNTGGLPLSGSTVNWKVVTPSAGATLQSASTTTGPNGQSSDIVTISSGYSGPVQVTATLASDATKSVTFNITVTPPVTVSQFQQISGNNQSAPVNTQFASPLVVKVTTSAGSASNVPVQFSVLSGFATLSANTVNTDANGLAQVTVTAGSSTGPVSVTATVPSFPAAGSVSFALTVVPNAPPVSSANFVNGADFQSSSLSPCSLGALVTTPGTLNVAPVTPTFPGTPIKTSNVQITFSNVAAPILSIGANAIGQQQVVFQVPCETVPGSAVPVTVSAGGAVSNVSLNVQAASPGIFQTQMSDNVLRALLVRPDGSFVSLTNPARQGEIVVSYVTGLGPTTAIPTTNSVPGQSPVPTDSANVMPIGLVQPGMAGGGADLAYAKLSEDLPGVFVVAFHIPANAPVGNDITFSVSVTPPGASAPISSAASKVPVGSVPK